MHSDSSVTYLLDFDGGKSKVISSKEEWQAGLDVGRDGIRKK